MKLDVLEIASIEIGIFEFEGVELVDEDWTDPIEERRDEFFVDAKSEISLFRRAKRCKPEQEKSAGVHI